MGESSGSRSRTSPVGAGPLSGVRESEARPTRRYGVSRVGRLVTEGPVTNRSYDRIADVLARRPTASTFVVTTPRDEPIGTVDRAAAGAAVSRAATNGEDG